MGTFESTLSHTEKGTRQLWRETNSFRAAMRPHPTSLRLPQSLLDQLDDTPGDKIHGHNV